MPMTFVKPRKLAAKPRSAVIHSFAAVLFSLGNILNNAANIDVRMQINTAKITRKLSERARTGITADSAPFIRIAVNIIKIKTVN